MPYIHQRGDYWRAEVRRRGYKPIYRSFDTRRQAEQWARRIESEIDAGVFIDRSEAERTLLSHFSYRDGAYPSYLPAQGTLYPGPSGAQLGTNVFSGEPDHNSLRRSEEAIGYEFEHRFSDFLTVRQNLRYTHADLDMDIAGLSALEDDLATADRYAFKANASVDTIALDNQAQLKFDTGALRHTALVGFDYLHSVDRWAEDDATSVPSLNLYSPVYGGAITYGGVDYSVLHHLDQLGTYAQDQIRFGRLVGTFGLREDWAKTDEYDRLAGATDQSNKASRLTWRSGLVYQFDNGLAPYVSYSTSFQPGLGNTYDGSALKPTTGQSFEAGVKYQPPGSKSFAMLSLYDIFQKNVTEPDYVHADGNYVVQTGAQRVQGAELSGVANLGQGVSLTASYTYMDGVVTASDQGYTGKQAVNVPHNMASLWLNKTFQGGPLNGVGFGAGVRYLGSQYGDQANTIQMPSVTLVDAAIHYDYDSHWRFSLNASNLFDRIYVNCQSSTFCAYGARRTVMGRVTYKW
jgi:iron complex outermembrane receptor protein